MHTLIRQLFSSAALVAAALLPQAQAQTQVIDFEGDALAGLYGPNELGFESFSQNGFTMTPGFDFGIVGTNNDFTSGAPSGNSSQYFFNSNDGDLLITRTDGGTFSLDGFSAAFVPLLPAPSPAQTIVIVAYAFAADGSQFGTYFGLGTGVNNRYPFLTYAGAADFGAFKNLVAVDFFGCVLTDTSVCSIASRNNAQFALDNVVVTTPVPEPSTYALMALGLAGLAVLRNRRKTLGSR